MTTPLRHTLVPTSHICQVTKKQETKHRNTSQVLTCMTFEGDVPHVYMVHNIINNYKVALCLFPDGLIG